MQVAFLTYSLSARAAPCSRQSSSFEFGVSRFK